MRLPSPRNRRAQRRRQREDVPPSTRPSNRMRTRLPRPATRRPQQRPRLRLRTNDSCMHMRQVSPLRQFYYPRSPLMQHSPPVGPWCPPLHPQTPCSQPNPPLAGSWPHRTAATKRWQPVPAPAQRSQGACRLSQRWTRMKQRSGRRWCRKHHFMPSQSHVRQMRPARRSLLANAPRPRSCPGTRRLATGFSDLRRPARRL